MRTGLMQMAIGSFVLTMFAVGTAWSDMNHSMIRVTCHPKLNYFEVEEVFLHSDIFNPYDGNPRRAADIARWRKQGFFMPDDFETRCKLATGTVTFQSNRPPGDEYYCGGAPEGAVRLRWGDKVLLEDARFGYSCEQRSTITKLTIGAGPGLFEVCLRAAQTDGEQPQVCKPISKVT